jgi:hypothetical protein
VKIYRIVDELQNDLDVWSLSGEIETMTQLGSALVAVALPLTAYFAIAAWQATAEERHDAARPTMMQEPAEAITLTATISNRSIGMIGFGSSIAAILARRDALPVYKRQPTQIPLPSVASAFLLEQVSSTNGGTDASFRDSRRH